MAEEQLCQSCKQRRDCKQIYAQMGNVKGTSVALSVFLAFLLPIVVFITGLATSQRIFTPLIQNSTVATLTSIIFALTITFFIILVVRSTMTKR